MTGRVLSHVRQRRREWIVPLLPVLEGAQEQSLPRKVRETGSRRPAREETAPHSPPSAGSGRQNPSETLRFREGRCVPRRLVRPMLCQLS